MPTGLVDHLRPQQLETDPVGVQRVRERHPLLGAQPSGLLRGSHIGFGAVGETAEEQIGVALAGLPERREGDERVVGVGLDLRTDALGHQLAQLRKAHTQRGGHILQTHTRSVRLSDCPPEQLGRG